MSKRYREIQNILRMVAMTILVLWAVMVCLGIAVIASHFIKPNHAFKGFTLAVQDLRVSEASSSEDIESSAPRRALGREVYPRATREAWRVAKRSFANLIVEILPLQDRAGSETTIKRGKRVPPAGL